LATGLRAIGIAKGAVAIVDTARDRQEAFGIAEERGEAGPDFADDASAKGGCIVLLPG
jgi:TctA family transporter